MSFFIKKMLYDGLMSHKSETLSVFEINMYMGGKRFVSLSGIMF